MLKGLILYQKIKDKFKLRELKRSQFLVFVTNRNQKPLLKRKFMMNKAQTCFKVVIEKSLALTINFLAKYFILYLSSTVYLIDLTMENNN